MNGKQLAGQTFRLPWGKRYALIVVLGYSRYLWLKSPGGSGD